MEKKSMAAPPLAKATSPNWSHDVSFWSFGQYKFNYLRNFKNSFSKSQKMDFCDFKQKSKNLIYNNEFLQKETEI